MRSASYEKWEARSPEGAMSMPALETLADQSNMPQYVIAFQASRLQTATTRATPTQHALQGIDTTRRIRDVRIPYPILKLNRCKCNGWQDASREGTDMGLLCGEIALGLAVRS
jgi:hypothetical protein